MKKILITMLCLFLLTSQVFAVDINDWIKGDGTDAVEGTDSVSDLDTLITNYLQDPLDKVLSHHLWGCELSYTSATVVTVAIGEVVCSNAAGTIRRFRKNVATTTVDMTVVGVGGIDSGSAEAVSTLYDVYAVADADATTFTAICAQQGNALSDVTYYRYIGSFYNDAGSDIRKFYMVDDCVFYDQASDQTIISGAGAGTTWTDLDMSEYMPSSSTLAYIAASASDSNKYRTNGSAVTGGIVVGNTTTQTHAWIASDSSQIIEYYLGSAVNIYVYLCGYKIKR